MTADVKKIMSSNQFSIWVGGDRPADALIGHLESGNSTIKGASMKAQSIGGMCMFPNYFQAWGRRVINGDVPKKYVDGTERTVVNVNDNDYKGEIEWLPTNDKNGYIIHGRYSKGQATLDYHYQINRLGLSKTSEDKNGAEDASFYVELPFGENVVFPLNDKAWAEMLLVHPMNSDSGSRMPDSEGNMYRVVKQFNSKKEELKILDKEFEAYAFVKNASTDFKSMEVLKEIMSRKHEIIYDKKDENSLFDSLAFYAKQKPVDFLESIAYYKANASEVIEKARAFSIFETSKDGELSVKNQLKIEHLITIKGKGEAMIESLFESSMTAQGFEAIRKLEGIVSKLK